MRRCGRISTTCNGPGQQSLILSWDHIHSTNTMMRTAFYQKWSSVHQLPESVDQYGAVTDAERTLRTFGIKSDVTRFHGRHTVKGGIDLVLLRPREDLYYLSQPWITYTHLPTVNEISRPLPWSEPRCRRSSPRFVQREGDRWPSKRVSAGQAPIDAQLHARCRRAIRSLQPDDF